MFCLILNILFFSIFLVREFLKYKTFKNPVLLVFVLYFLVAVCGVFFSIDNNEYLKMEILSCLYFYLICCMAFIPLNNSFQISKNIEIKETLLFKMLLAFYFIMAIISSYDYYIMLTEELSLGDWATLKQNVYNNDFHLQNGVVNVFARLITQSLKYAILGYGFYCLTNNKKTVIYGLFFIVLGIVPSIVKDLAFAFRGGLGVDIILLLFIYFLFEGKMIKKNLKYINTIFFTTGICVILFTLAITFSRFDDSSGNSLVSYFGQSMIDYNAGIASRINNYAGGRYFFSRLINEDVYRLLLDSNYGISTNDGQNLDTFVGPLLIDFGFVGGFLFFLVVSVLLNNYLKSRKYNLVKISVLLFYVNFLLTGAFHIANGFAYDILWFLIFSFILKCSFLSVRYGK